MTDLHEDNESQRAPGYDPELHDCSVCLDTGLSLIDGSYCDACQLGGARARQDKFSDELQAHGFKPAMWIVMRSTQKTERAIAAAEKALLLNKVAKLEAKLAAYADPEWKLVPKISTTAMDRAAEAAYESNGHCDCGNANGTSMEQVFTAMLNAAPSTSTSGEQN